ncbi:MAG: acyl-ACP--UDP-N-acetylglucosamine O-acyltransferase, partial [Kiritimatiellia bacterium]|nr:acyl-ACP--UDP-N-acetylglucosamine O-acyltransferase [Kiritimatiellia bacterium]
MSIHPSAWIDPGAIVEADVDIGPFCVVESGVRLGAGCRLGAHVSILSGTTLGPRCRIHGGAVLGDLPQDLAFTNAPSRVEIGADCVIREQVTIHRGTKEGTVTSLGEGCYLMANSHVAHNCRVGNRVILANGALLGGYVEVGDRAFLSANVLVHQFVHIGRLVMAGGGSALGKDVPPFCMVQSVRRNSIVGLNIIGLRRAGFLPEQRQEIRRAFDVLYRSGLNFSKALERLREEFP